MNWKVFGRLAIAWIVTMPAAAVVACVVYLICTKLPRPAAVAVMAVVLLALVVALVMALRRAPKAQDVDPGKREVRVGMRPGAGSVIDARGVPASRDVLEHGGSLDDAEATARAQSRPTGW